MRNGVLCLSLVKHQLGFIPALLKLFALHSASGIAFTTSGIMFVRFALMAGVYWRLACSAVSQAEQSQS